MENELSHNQKHVVFAYEMAGTAMLVYAVNVSGGNPIAVAFTLFSCILIGGPITGGHFNPAVSTGYFLSQKMGTDAWQKLAVIWMTMIIAQFLGGLLGITLAFCSLTNEELTVDYIKGSIPTSEQVILRPKVGVQQAFNIEVICTFMFVMVILVVKTARLSPTKQGLLAVLGVVWNLMALTQTAGASGACLNPAVGFAQAILQFTQAIIPDEHFETVCYMYVVAPFVGGMLSGVAHKVHKHCFDNVTNTSKSTKESAIEPLIQRTDEFATCE